MRTCEYRTRILLNEFAKDIKGGEGIGATLTMETFSVYGNNCVIAKTAHFVEFKHYGQCYLP